ncbi:MAG: glycosyltransferase [Deltaproteobacteria bacterium]|nr:glycosyltransferase [Deltaproteobacteria bacterium]
MKVLAIGSTFDLPEVHIFAGLVKRGVSVEAIVSSDSKLVGRLAEFGIPCTTLDFRSKFDLRAILALRRILKAGNFDILHCLTARAVSNALVASFGLRAKRIAYRGTSGRDSRLSPASWMTFLNPGIHKIICVSNAVRSFMSTMVPASKLTTIYKGHDIAWYQAHSAVQLSEFGIPQGAFVVACVANMRPVKGVQHLLKALRDIPPETNIRVLLIGEVRKSADMQELQDSAIAPRVHLAGFRSDVGTILSRCQAFVLPSISREGLPKAMMEALAIGVPTIVTNVGGMPEVVTHLENGLVVPPADSGAIAKAILSLHADPELAKTLGAAGQRSIVETFNVSNSVEATLVVYRSLCP